MLVAATRKAAAKQTVSSRLSIIMPIVDIGGPSPSVNFVPAQDIRDANAQQRVPLSYLEVSAKDIAQPNTAFRVSAALRFSGAQRLAVLAYGKTSHLTVEGDWPSPGFDGAFLPEPERRDLTEVLLKSLPQSRRAHWISY